MKQGNFYVQTTISSGMATCPICCCKIKKGDEALWIKPIGETPKYFHIQCVPLMVSLIQTVMFDSYRRRI